MTPSWSAPGFLMAALGLLSTAIHAQPGEEVSPDGTTIPPLSGLMPLTHVPVLTTPTVEVAASRAVSAPGEPFRFAEPFAVDISPASHGKWEATSDSRTAVWRLRVVSDGAVSLNLGFTRYRMPPGGTLRVHTPDGAEAVGPYTDADNETHGELWTPIISGGDAVIEVTVPAHRVGELELRLESVNRGFRDLTSVDARSHQNCHIDVVCPEADPYRNQVRSVGLLSFNGTAVCSGVLLNNTARDDKPYFLTARHCIANENVSTTVIYWNFESPTCGTRRRGSKQQSQSGAYLRAEHGASDFALLELDDALDPDHNLYFAGWDRSGTLPTSVASIHHPRLHVKSLNLATGPFLITDFFYNEPDTTKNYLKILEWGRRCAGEWFVGSTTVRPEPACRCSTPRWVLRVRAGRRRLGGIAGTVLERRWRSSEAPHRLAGSRRHGDDDARRHARGRPPGGFHS